MVPLDAAWSTADSQKIVGNADAARKFAREVASEQRDAFADFFERVSDGRNALNAAAPILLHAHFVLLLDCEPPWFLNRNGRPGGEIGVWRQVDPFCPDVACETELLICVAGGMLVTYHAR